ncbi:phage tail assembly-like protein [Salmonella phage SPFM9]|nr:phage tail assembly-like protein [Salmonella phage SPFM9]
MVYSRPVEKTLSYNRNYLFKSFYHAVHEFGWPSYVDDNSFADLMFLRIMEALGVDTFIRSVGFYPDTVEGNLSRACDKTPDGPWAAAACVHDLFYQKRSPRGFVTDLASIPEALRPILHMDAMVALAGVHPDTPLWVTVLTDDFHFEFTLRSLYREQTG